MKPRPKNSSAATATRQRFIVHRRVEAFSAGVIPIAANTLNPKQSGGTANPDHVDFPVRWLASHL